MGGEPFCKPGGYGFNPVRTGEPVKDFEKRVILLEFVLLYVISTGLS